MKILIVTLLFLTACEVYGFCSVNIPGKPYQVIKIPDGEFLKYTGYGDGGEIEANFYQVTRVETNSSGDVLYRIYQNLVSSNGMKKGVGNYKKWPSFYLIDPAMGSVIESMTAYSTSDTTNAVNKDMGLQGLVYWHYKFDPESGNAVDVTKYVKGVVTNTKTFRLNIKPGYPVWDATSLIYFLGRFLDPDGKGVFFMAAPEIMKNPVPFSIKIMQTDSLTTKAGSFKVKKIGTISGDPFIGKLMETYMKNWIIWVSESDDRRIIKLRPPAGGGYIVLEEISNVI